MTLSLNDKMPFGKYKGRHVMNVPISYLRWAIKTWTNIIFTEEVKKEIERQTALYDKGNKYDGVGQYVPEEVNKKTGRTYTKWESTLLHQYRQCYVGADYEELRRNNLDLTDAWDTNRS